MNDLHEQIQYRGQDINIFYDTHNEGPDEWGNEDSFIVYDHRQFSVQRDGFNPDDIWERYGEEGKKTYEGYWIFPLYAYIHSGVSLSLASGGCRWDTSMKGFALVKRQKGWSWTIEQATQIAQSQIDEWNLYLSGQVYTYQTEFDSCSGFYGDEGIKEAINEAKASIDRYYSDILTQHIQKLKNWIKSKVNIQYRKPLQIS